MGKCIRIINEKISILASETTWIEGAAIQQLEYVATLKDMKKIVGLPDLHPGRAYPIGAAFLTSSTLYPALIGNDIGCGMGLWETDIDIRKVKQDKWEKQIRKLAFSNQDEWTDRETDREIATLTEEKLSPNDSEFNDLVKSFNSSLGTIGGGNHFAEYQKITKVVNASLFGSLDLNTNKVMLLVHSGSRGLGEAILRDHVNQFNHQGLDCDSPEGQRYLAQHDFALHWAEINRSLIAERLAAAVGLALRPVLDVNHNLVTRVVDAETGGWLHRKGATPADKGVVIIPGSRGDHSYLVKPTSSPISLFSLAHGAGRKWKRTECEGRLRNRYRATDLSKTRLGSRVICDDKALMYEEAPEAYKPIDSVVNDLVSAGLIDVIAELTPIITFKNASTQGKPCCKEER